MEAFFIDRNKSNGFVALIISLYRQSLWRYCRSDKSNDISYVTTRFPDVNFHLNFSMNLPRDAGLQVAF